MQVTVVSVAVCDDC